MKQREREKGERRERGSSDADRRTPGLQIWRVHGLTAMGRPREDDDINLQCEVDDGLTGSRWRRARGRCVAPRPQTLGRPRARRGPASSPERRASKSARTRRGLDQRGRSRPCRGS